VIRLSKSTLTKVEKEAVMGVLDREFLGMGYEVQLFEERLSEFIGRPAICVVNGTAALHLACQAAGIGLGDEVLVQSLTYVASYQAISATGAKPISCDVVPDTFTIDWRDAEKRLTKHTKAIMPMHYAGGVGKLNEIYDFAKCNGLRVIEDAAHAFGSLYRGQRVGGFGDIACFSFDGIKNITSGEGGCIVSDDEEILKKVRDSRLLGVEHDTENRFKGNRSWEFDVTSQGWRYHMSNIMAAIGIVQLDRFPELSSKRKSLAKCYADILSSVDYIKILPYDFEEVVPHIFPVLIDNLKDRSVLRKNLLDVNIQTGIHYQPNHMLSLYRDIEDVNLPVTDSIFPELVSLPIHPDLSIKEVEMICEKLLSEIQCLV